MTKKKIKKLEEIIDIEELSEVEEVKGSVRKKSKGGFGVINAPTGKRVTLTKKIYSKLKEPEAVQVALLDEEVLIGEVIPNCKESHLVRQTSNGGGVCIYCAGLVKAITEKYQLDFSDCSSMTFSDIEYCRQDGKRIAVVHMVKEDEEDMYEGGEEDYE